MRSLGALSVLYTSAKKYKDKENAITKMSDKDKAQYRYMCEYLQLANVYFESCTEAYAKPGVETDTASDKVVLKLKQDILADCTS